MMISNRLNSLMKLSYEKGIVNEIDIDAVVTKLSSAKQRRVKV